MSLCRMVLLLLQTSLIPLWLAFSLQLRMQHQHAGAFARSSSVLKGLAGSRCDLANIYGQCLNMSKLSGTKLCKVTVRQMHVRLTAGFAMRALHKQHCR